METLLPVLASGWFQAGSVVLLGASMMFVSRNFQRCPHCRRVVSRARRGWLRCRACGRQYHRSVHLKR